MESVLSHEICRREIGVEKRTNSSRNSCPFPADIIVTDHVSCKRTCSESKIGYTVQMPTISPKMNFNFSMNLEYWRSIEISTAVHEVSRSISRTFPSISYITNYIFSQILEDR